MMATQNVPDVVIRQMLAAALQIVIHCSRLTDGTRKITGISEVLGVEEGHLELQDIFVLERVGIGAHGRVRGRFVPTGNLPRVLERLSAYGIQLPVSIFEGEQALKER